MPHVRNGGKTHSWRIVSNGIDSAALAREVHEAGSECAISLWKYA